MKLVERIYVMINRIKIYDGVHLNTIASEKFKTNYMSVCFVVPLDKADAHLTALVPKILSRGCRNYPDMAKISERLEYLYDAGITPIYVKRAQSIIVGFSADFIKNEFVPDENADLLSDVSELLFDILFDPLVENESFREDYTQGEKTDLVNLINSKINNKAAYAKEKCTSLMFGDHSYGYCEYGTKELVETADAKKVYARYKEIINNSPVEIFFNGECEDARLAEIIKKRVPENADRKTVFPGKEFLTGEPEEIKEVSEKMPVAQGKLVMGFRMGGINLNSDNSAAFSVFNEIFGGSPSSKLFMNVREAMSLCYYCRSMPDMFISAMFVSSGIETENFEKAKNAILLQLEDVKCGKFTDDEIDDAKRSIQNAYREIDDSASTLCMWYLSRIISGNTSTPESVRENIFKVTKKDIVDAAKNVSLDTVYFIEGTPEMSDNQEVDA